MVEMVVVAGVAAAVVILDTAGCVVSCNAEAERVIGQPSSEILGRPCSVLVPALGGGAALDASLRRAADNHPVALPWKGEGAAVVTALRAACGDITGFALLIREHGPARLPDSMGGWAIHASGEARVLLDASSWTVLDVSGPAATFLGGSTTALKGARFDVVAAVSPRSLAAAVNGLNVGVTRHARLRGRGGEMDVTMVLLPSRRGRLLGLTILERGEFPETAALKIANERLARLAHYDGLTGLANRHYFTDYLAKAVARARRRREKLAVLFIDLDNFKPVNDSLGHEAGDGLLAEVAQRLRRCTRDSDMIARYGGDEFVVAMEGVAGGAADEVAVKIATAIGEPMVIEGQTVEVSASIGAALYPDTADTVQGLIQAADKAMYDAKRSGRKRGETFPPAPDETPPPSLTSDCHDKSAYTG